MTEMPDHESLLAARFAALATPDAGDWLDVRRRARRGRVRKAALLLAAAIAAILVAAPALGLRSPRGRRVAWRRACTARHSGRVRPTRRGAGGPLQFDPRVIPNAARKVTTVEHEGKEHVLWVAPTARGGFCFLWTDAFGGCVADRELPRVQTRPGELNPLLLGATWGRTVACRHRSTVRSSHPRPIASRWNTRMGASPTSPSCGSRRRSTQASTSTRFHPSTASRGTRRAALVARDHDGTVLARKLLSHAPDEPGPSV